MTAKPSRIGQDDNSYDANSLAEIATTMIAALENGTSPEQYATFAGPHIEGFDELLEATLTPSVASEWLTKAQLALASL